jgi:hypothetical protein
LDVPLLRRAPACALAVTTLVVHSLAIAAPPPEQPEIEAEIPANQPATELDAAAPLEPEPVEPEPEPELPSWDAELPSYDQAPETEPAPSVHVEPETPRDGNGATVVGAMLLGGGLVLTATSASLIFFDWNEVGIWIAGSAIGSVAIATGMGVLIAGVVRRSRYEPWRRHHAAPPQGIGMLAGGSLALSAGAFGMMMGGISLTLEDEDDLPYGAVVLSLGAISVSTGVALLVVGAKRRRAFNQWDRARVVPTLGFVPSPQMRTAGATFGIAGRF